MLVFLITFMGCSNRVSDSSGGSDGAVTTTEDSKKEFFELMGYDRLTLEETETFLKNEDAIVIDVRNEEQYKRGHLPGALNIYYDEFMGKRNDAIPDLNQPILVYCDYGGLSGMVADELVSQGYTDVHDFDGMDYWKGEVETG